MGGDADLFVAVIGQTLERANRGRRRGETQRLDRRCAQGRGFPSEQPAARLAGRAGTTATATS